MASTPSLKKTNLFGDASTANSDSSVSGGGTGIGFGGSSNGSAGTPDSTDAAASAWFEEDDELVLAQLLRGEENESSNTRGEPSTLDDKLSRLKGRLLQDLSRITTTDGNDNDSNDSWWRIMMQNAASRGFAAAAAAGDSSDSSRSLAAAPAGAAKEDAALPKSFHTPSGRAHVGALVDLLDVPPARAARLTLASLRSFAAAGGNNAPAEDGAAPSPPAAAPDGEESRLRSLLGSTDLFRHVLRYHRSRFLARLRVVTESLRREQERSADTGGQEGRAGASCAAFLDGLDGRYALEGRKRGLLRLLLRLAAGPPLPGMGAGELPHSVSRLRGGVGLGEAGGAGGGGAEEENTFLLAVRHEAAEALLVLLYERFDGGVRRLDLHLVLEAAARCRDLEFGTTAAEYGGRYAAGDRLEAGGRTEAETATGASRRRLDGQWALICADCMGLWRTNKTAGGSCGWVGRHPLFAGLDFGDANGDGRAGSELDALCDQLRGLGEAVRARRHAAYNRRRKRRSAVGAAEEEDDEELWGIRAPEAVALLAFGLLLRLAAPSAGDVLGDRGAEFAQVANDECGAFAYLQRVLKAASSSPASGGDGDGGDVVRIARRRMRAGAGERWVSRLLCRGESDMPPVEEEGGKLAVTNGDGGLNSVEGEASADHLGNATSIVCSSIGREILAATIRAFRGVLLDLRSRARAAENVALLAGLAGAVYGHEPMLCEAFWGDWEDFCQSDGNMEHENGEDGETEETKSDEPVCYLLDASHTLAVSALAELKVGQAQPQSILHYLNPLSTFIHLIVSLCASPVRVSAVLTSKFLPEGLLDSALSVVSALASQLSSLETTANGDEVTAEERSTLRHAVVVLQSVSALARLGGAHTRALLRRSLLAPNGGGKHGSEGGGAARIICSIALQASPTAPLGHSSQGKHCAELSTAALDLLLDLSVDAGTEFQLETLACFSSSHDNNTLVGRDYGNFGGKKFDSGFGLYLAKGMESTATLAVASILNCLAINLVRNVFRPTRHGASSAPLPLHIETVGVGIMLALDVLSSIASSGEVAFPQSILQVDTAHAILLAAAAALVGLKQVAYLHPDDATRHVALATHHGILSSLSSSTALGQVVAHLAVSPLSLALTQQVGRKLELELALKTSAKGYDYQESRGGNGSGRDGGMRGKYGAWGRFVTPKRASQRASKRMRSAVAASDALYGADDYGLYDVAVAALSLLLVWGEHAEDVADDNGLRAEPQQGPCALLLSRCPPSSLRPLVSGGAMGLNVTNLDLVSRYSSAHGGFASRSGVAAVLSASLIKICLRHADSAMPPAMQHGAFCVALGGGSHLFRALLSALDGLLDESGAEGGVRTSEQATVLLEAVAASISRQPDLARVLLLGDNMKEDWRIVDKMVSIIVTTGNRLNASRESNDQTDVEEKKKLNLLCLVTCACLQVFAELWKCCRLTASSACPTKKSNDTDDGSAVHACGSIVSHLTNNKETLIANVTAELTRCVLLSVMSLGEKNAMHKETPTSMLNQKSILLDILKRSLDIIAIETMSRAQIKSQGDLNFTEDLFDTGPMECWKFLLSSSSAGAAASSWLHGFSSAVGRDGSLNWDLVSFLRANPQEEEASASVWCSFGHALQLAQSLEPVDGPKDRGEAVASFRHCSALHVLTASEVSFAASWSTFFQVITAEVGRIRPGKEVHTLASVVARTTLFAMSSFSESQMLAQSLLSSQGLLESRDTTSVAELSSLMLFALTIRRDIGAGEDAPTNCQDTLEMIALLHGSANKLFVMTQPTSMKPSDQCLIRQNLLACALVLISEFENIPQRERVRDDIVRYNTLRIAFTDLSVNALQSIEYVQPRTASEESAAAIQDDAFVPTKYGYGFSASEHGLDLSGQEAALQLLLAAVSLLCRLSPTTTIGSGASMGDYQTYSYGVDFAACLKERNAMGYIQSHLNTASMVASLTYQAVQRGSASHSVAVIHNKSIDVVCEITTFFRALTDAGSIVVNILLLLVENRCYRSLIDNPLLKVSSNLWSSTGVGVKGDETIPSVLRHHRGYYTGLPLENLSSSKGRPTSQKDPAHFIWREVINIFSSLIRSARCQVQTYAQVDEVVLRKLNPSTSVVLDFVCTFEDELFTCFSSMLSEAHSQTLSNKGSPSIHSSPFAFTPNLLKESRDISTLFAELCRSHKNELVHQCKSIYNRICSTSLELTKMMSSFLGSIGNARELFLALSSASTITLDQPTAMFDAHPLLAEGIPNARHEAIRNTHFAHSCCILATLDDFTNSHMATTKAGKTSSGKSLEQTFQIQVNNEFIAEVENIAGHCLFSVLSVLSDTHPASDSFISFSSEEASRLDVAAVIMPGTTVAICSQTGAQKYSQRYTAQLNRKHDFRYGRAFGCDRATRTISVEYADSGTVERHVPWSSVVGMEDTSKRQCILSYAPAPKSVADTDSPSIGHLILALKWCRNVGLSSLANGKKPPLQIAKFVAERASILLTREASLHEELRDKGLPCNDTLRRVNLQLLDLFDYTETRIKGLNPRATASTHQGEKSSLASVMGEDVLRLIHINLECQLQAACLEREEEQKMWEQNNNSSGWDNTHLWTSSSKRQGRRSPFRLMRKTSSGDAS